MLILLLTKTGSWRAGSRSTAMEPHRDAEQQRCRAGNALHTRKHPFFTDGLNYGAEQTKNQNAGAKLQGRRKQADGCNEKHAARSYGISNDDRESRLLSTDAASNRIANPRDRFCNTVCRRIFKGIPPRVRSEHCTVCNPTATPITVFEDESTIVCKSCANLEKKKILFCHRD